jgi:hydrogenase expression/formation protein HypE
MLPGKIPPEILQNIVFSKLGKRDPDVLLGPELGEDAAVIKIGDQVLIAATDPITGSVEDVGWIAVHANANDIATFGISPKWFLVSITQQQNLK